MATVTNKNQKASQAQQPEEEPKKENQKASQAQQPPSKKINGSVDTSYKLDKEEDHLVHYLLQDFAAPRPKDLNEEFKPVKRVVKVSPHMFVTQFAPNYDGNDAFTNVNTPSKIIAISENITKEHLEDAYADDIQSATKGKPREKAKYLDRLLNEKKKLRMMGGNQFAKVLHIPKNDLVFPFTEIDKFPEDCMH